MLQRRNGTAICLVMSLLTLSNGPSRGLCAHVWSPLLVAKQQAPHALIRPGNVLSVSHIIWHAARDNPALDIQSYGCLATASHPPHPPVHS